MSFKPGLSIRAGLIFLNFSPFSFTNEAQAFISCEANPLPEIAFGTCVVNTSNSPFEHHSR